MKKNIWIAAGIAGMLFAYPSTDAKAEVSLRIHAGDRAPVIVREEHRAPFVIERQPDFIALPGFGFSVSVGGPFDVISYGSFYYVNHHGSWYRSSNYRGPWIFVTERSLPSSIRKHSWEDIRRFRDEEYRRHEGRRDRFERDRHERDQRDRDNRDRDQRGFNGNDQRGDYRNDRR